jgi:hypothetical protein
MFYDAQFFILPKYRINIFVVLLSQVLFKTRCDNRLNEITERAAADKREVSDSMEFFLVS